MQQKLRQYQDTFGAVSRADREIMRRRLDQHQIVDDAMRRLVEAEVRMTEISTTAPSQHQEHAELFEKEERCEKAAMALLAEFMAEKDTALWTEPVGLGLASQAWA